MKVNFPRLKTLAFILLFFLLLRGTFSQTIQKPDLDGMYWDGRFNDVLLYLQDRPYDAHSLKEKLLLIECLARTGRSSEALMKISEILPESPDMKDVNACAGWVYFSLGNFERAEKYWNKSLAAEEISHPSIFGKIMLLLFFKRYADAENLFFHYLREHPDKAGCFQTFLIGIEVFNATRNTKELYNWYSKRAEAVKKTDKKTYSNLRANAKVYKRIKNETLFEVETSTDTFSIPFVESSQNRFWLINFRPTREKTFTILLDTGNAAGWMIHDLELYDDLKVKTGGKIVASIGSEVEALDGYRIYNEKINFDDWKICHLIGNYIPKPRPDFFDANFNPSFIRNRVVTLDGIQKKMILRTKKAFDRYLSGQSDRRVTKIPWYGYEHVFVPVVVNRIHSGLGIIETGAEDIAIKLDFARVINLPLSPKIKYLSNGRVFRFFETPADVSLGSFQFQKKSVEVWSFDRFSRHLTGLKADVVFGPLVFRQEYVLSFDPFDQVLVVEGVNL